MPNNSVYVGRGSKYGNPFPIEKYGIDEALRLYSIYFDEQVVNCKIDFTQLIGKNLCCWCRLDQPCHADILLKYAAWLTVPE